MSAGATAGKRPPKVWAALCSAPRGICSLSLTNVPAKTVQAPPAHPATASYDNGPRELARGVWLSQITDHPNQGDASVQATLRIPAEKMGLLEGENIGVQKHIQEQAKVRLETKELEQNPQPYRDLLIKAR